MTTPQMPAPTPVPVAPTELEKELREIRSRYVKFEFQQVDLDRLFEIVDELRADNALLRKGFEDRAQFDKLGDDMAKKMFYPSYYASPAKDQTIDDLRSKIETLKTQRETFKALAESAVATVKEQEERLRRSEAVVAIVKEVTLLTQDKYGHFSIVTKLQELTDKTTESLKAYDSACGKGETK